MNDFFSDLFEEASNPKSDKLGEYDEDDLRNFFESEVQEPRRLLVEAATSILQHLEDPNIALDQSRLIGLSAKNAEKLAAFVKKQKADLQSLALSSLLQSESRLQRFDWSVRSVFFSKRDEFKGQKKYGVLDFDVQADGKTDKIKLNCSKENVLAIRDKLGKLDEAIRQVFEEAQSS
jgi:hypothetical protein